MLNDLIIKGITISIDARGHQSKIAKTTVKKEADNMLAVKENQASLDEDIINKFQANNLIQTLNLMNV